MLKEYFENNTIRKIQLGCGPHKLDGWLNTDLTSNGDNDIFELDVTQHAWPLPNDSFDYIFCEHMIEHISYLDGINMLKECHRILKPGGKIRIVTPDVNFLINLYKNKEDSLHKSYTRWSVSCFTPWAPSIDPIFVLNNFVRDWGHTFIYDKNTLINAITSVGFRMAEDFEICMSNDIHLSDLENPTRMPEGFLKLESMCLQAYK